MNWTYYWSVRDDALYIYENGNTVAKINPEHFKHLIAELSEHLRWQEEKKK